MRVKQDCRSRGRGELDALWMLYAILGLHTIALAQQPTSQMSTQAQKSGVWQLSSFPNFNITGTYVLDLERVLVLDSTGFNQQRVANQSFASLLLLPWVGVVAPTATAVLQHVRVNTSCRTLAAIQRAACNGLSLEQLGRLQVVPGRVYVPRWADERVTAVNVTFVCDLPPTTIVTGAPLVSLWDGVPDASMDCAVDQVDNWQSLVAQSRLLQEDAATVHILLQSSITAPGTRTVIDGKPEPDRDVIEVYRNVRVAPAPGVDDGPVRIQLEYVAGQGLWHMASPNGTLLFQRIVFTELPLGPAGKFPMSVIPWGLWAVSMERCNPIVGALVLSSCVLVAQPETMDYSSHWAGNFLSVFPDVAASAAWYGVDTTCNPPQNRTLLNQQIRLQDQLTWLATNATSFGAHLINTTITSRPPAGSPPVPPGLQLTKLFDDPYTPFNTITWVSTASELVQAFTEQSVPNVVILSNLTIPASLWPLEPIALRRDMVITGWPSRCTVLDWEGVAGVLDVAEHTLKIRNLWLMNGGQGGPNSNPSWAANLTLYQWPIIHNWDASNTLQLQSVSLVVPPSEFDILKRHSTVPQQPVGEQSPGAAVISAALAWLQTATFRSNSCSISKEIDSGFLGMNVSLTSVPVAYPMLPLQVILGQDSSFDNSPTLPPSVYTSSSPSAHAWEHILIIVLPSAVGLVLLAASGAFLLWWRRKRQPEPGPGKTVKSAGGHHTPGSTDLEAAISGGHSPTSASVLVGLSGNEKRSSPTAGTLNDTSHSMIDLFQMSLAQQQRTVPSLGNGSAGVSPASVGQASSQSTRQSLSFGLNQPPLGLNHSQQGFGGHLPDPSMHRDGTWLLPDSGGLQGHGVPRQQQLRPGSKHSADTYTDSFEIAPPDQGLLLINRFDLSPDLQAAAAAPDVAAQLKQLVMRMQHELGDQEVSITRVIGHGGSGVVYQGQWRGLKVAVKSLVFTVLPSQPMSRRQQRAMTEAAICRTLQHPNIVATYSYDLQTLQSTRPGGVIGSPSTSHSRSTGGSSEHHSHSSGIGPKGPEASHIDSLARAAEYKLYIIQEFCDGGTLKSIVDDGLLHMSTTGGKPEPLLAPILQLATDIARGMAHVHSCNIVHGDLTPANVLLKINEMAESHFSAKVADFGLSWKLSNGQEHVSNARQGTGFYISPEVLHVGIMSKPADVFSFGMLLHEMYHGTPVWRRGHADMAEAAEAATKRPGLEQLSWSPACPPALRSLISACLSADAQARPTFKSIITKLENMKERLLQGMGVIASPPHSTADMESAAQLQTSDPHQAPVNAGPKGFARASTPRTLSRGSLTTAAASTEPLTDLSSNLAVTMASGGVPLIAGVRALPSPDAALLAASLETMHARSTGGPLSSNSAPLGKLRAPTVGPTLWPVAEAGQASELASGLSRQGSALPMAWDLLQHQGSMSGGASTPRWSVGHLSGPLQQQSVDGETGAGVAAAGQGCDGNCDQSLQGNQSHSGLQGKESPSSRQGTQLPSGLQMKQPQSSSPQRLSPDGGSLQGETAGVEPTGSAAATLHLSVVKQHQADSLPTKQPPEGDDLAEWVHQNRPAEAWLKTAALDESMAPSVSSAGGPYRSVSNGSAFQEHSPGYSATSMLPSTFPSPESSASPPQSIEGTGGGVPLRSALPQSQ